MSQFADPAAPSSGITWADHNNQLLLVTVHGVETAIPTQFGESDAVRADVVVLDGPEPGREYTDTLIFPKLLQSQLRSQTGKQVLGRLGQGAGKPGQSPPWVLSPASDEDKALGARYIASRMGAPEQPQQQPNPQPQGQASAAQQWPQQQAQPPQGQPQSVPF